MRVVQIVLVQTPSVIVVGRGSSASSLSGGLTERRRTPRRVAVVIINRRDGLAMEFQIPGGYGGRRASGNRGNHGREMESVGEIMDGMLTTEEQEMIVPPVKKLELQR